MGSMGRRKVGLTIKVDQRACIDTYPSPSPFRSHFDLFIPVHCTSIIIDNQRSIPIYTLT